MMFHPTLLSGFLRMQADPSDTRLVQYFLEHSFQVFFNRSYIATLWSPTFFYPFPNVLAFSENLWGAAPLYWLLRAVASTDIAFQLWMIVVSALNFFSFAFVLQRQQIRHELAGLGAFLFAFGMPRLAQMGHPQLLPQFFTPLALLVLWEFSRQPTRRRLALSLLLIYLQVLAGIYLGWFLLLSLLVAIPWLWGLDREFRVVFLSFCRTHFVSSFVIVLGWATAMFITLRPYLQLKAEVWVGDRPYAEIEGLIPRWTSWFSPTHSSLWGSLWYDSVVLKLPLYWEHSLFLGLTVLGLLGLCVYAGWLNHKTLPARFLLVKLCLGVSAVLFLLSLRWPNGFSLWKFVYTLVPGAIAIRAVTRIWTVLDLYLLTAICLGVDTFFKSIFKSVVRWRAVPILWVILCLCIGEQLTVNPLSYEKAPYSYQRAALTQLMRGCDVAYLQMRYSVLDQLTAMWAGLQASVPVVNGYSGLAPPNYYRWDQPMNSPQVVNWLMQSQKKGFEKPQLLCMISRPAELNQEWPSSTHWVTPRYRVDKIQLPIALHPAAEIQYLPGTLPKLQTGDSFQLPVILKNTSNFVWSTWGRHPTNFSYQWFNSSGKLSREPLRTSLPKDLNPGGSTAIVANIQAPYVPGEYRLVLTMVQEEMFWFYGYTPDPISIPLKVEMSESS